MALSNMQVFNQFVYSTYTEVIAQQVRLFNAASRNTLILANASNIGDFHQEAVYGAIAGLIRRRDAYGSGSVSPVALAQLLKNTVKVAGGTPPIAFEPQQFSWIQRSPEEAGVVIGEQLAEGMFGDYLNTAVRSLVAAISNNSALEFDGTAGNLSLNSLVSGSALFGDRAARLRAWIIHSKPMHDLWGAAVTNGNELFSFGTVNVVEDGFGRVFIMTDSPALVTAGSPDEYHTIGLVEGGAMIEDNGDLYTNIEETNGEENIERTMQAEYTFNVGLKGYSWNTAAGGASPTDNELATGTNWPKYATDNKDTAGVMVNSD